jgi:hypothetical protein
MDGRASPHHSTECDGVVSPPVCATGLSLIARGGLIGAAPRGQPRTSAVTLRQGRNGLSARQMAVWYTFCAPSLCRHAHRECMRSAVRDVIPTISATACHQRNDVERYSRCTQGLSSGKLATSSVSSCSPMSVVLPAPSAWNRARRRPSASGMRGLLHGGVDLCLGIERTV